jgi:hypothetical protein
MRSLALSALGVGAGVAVAVQNVVTFNPRRSATQIPPTLTVMIESA